jgi:predicted cation transporter
MGFTKVGIIIILKLNLGVRVMSWEDQPELTYFFKRIKVTSWSPTHLNDSCGALNSTLVIFFGVVEFTLSHIKLVIFFGVVEFIFSRSFQQYWWCHHQNFGVPLGSFFLFFFFSLSSIISLFIVNYVNLFYNLRES